MPNTPPNLLAGGTIRTCRFSKVSGDRTVLECDANDKIIGISQEGADQPPLSDMSITEKAADSGDTVRLFGDGDVCLLMAGDVIVAGDRLKSDNDGQGVPILLTGTTRQEYGAIALEGAAASGRKILVQVTLGVMLPAVA